MASEVPRSRRFSFIVVAADVDCFTAHRVRKSCVSFTVVVVVVVGIVVHTTLVITLSPFASCRPRLLLVVAAVAIVVPLFHSATYYSSPPPGRCGH